MFSLLAKDAPNIEKLAEQLESEANHHNDGNSRLDTRDYVRAIEEVLSSHQSPASAAKELWEKYSPEATEAEIAKLWEQKGGSQTQEESAPMEETEVLQPLTINGEEISFSADNSNPQTASQEPKLLTPNDPKFKRLQKAINRFLSKIKGYSTEVLHGQDFQKLVDWAKRQQDVSKEEGGGVDVETKQQIENFGVNKADVEPVHNVISQVFNGLKKAGLTAAKTVGDWVGIGKGSEKPYSLKIDGKDVKVKPTSSDVVNGFYSPLEKVVTDSKFDKLPAKQWIEKYANSEEAKWTGLKDWLAQQQGSVSKADIQQFLKDNRIQVVEVVKDGEILEEEIDTLLNDEVGQDMTRDEARAFLENDERQDDTKFSQYQLEGQKENYKEVLVTMPKTTERWDIIDNKGNVFNTVDTKVEAEGIANMAANVRKERFTVQKQVKTDFKSSHFDEPNILVHLRMNTRTDSKGNKVLFLEEVQSDWGQKGKKEGFKGEELDPANLTFKVTPEGTFNLYQLYDKNGNLVYELPASKSKGDNVFTKESLRQEFKGSQAIELMGKTTPTAPFVTDTNAWTKLGLKVALKEAVAQGATKIAWTTGEQQVGRYEDDFRKQVDKIETYKRISADVPSVHVIASKGSSQVFDHIIPINGKTIVSGKEVDLEDVVGKEIANKIRNSEEKQQSFEGDALTIGGKGMEDFYGKPSDAIRSKSFTIKKEGELFAVKDEKGKTIRTFKQENEANKFKENYGLGIVGNVAKSLFKQEPKTVEIDASKKPNWVIKNENGDIVGAQFETRNAAQEFANRVNNGKGRTVELLDKNNSTQHSIDITPELKASVAGGQPLFKDAEAQYRIESGKNIVEAIKDFDGSPRATVALTHEIMHPTVVAIIDGAKEGNEVGTKHTETIVNEFNKANPNNKVTTEDLIKGNDAFKDGTTSKQYRAVQEFIAKSWEKYHREGGKGFSESFQKVLDQITQAFKSVYKSISGKELTPELRKMFDEILGKEQSLKETPQEGSGGVGGDAESIKQIAKENGIEVVENKEGFKFKSGSREFQINHRGSKEDTIRKGVEKMIRLQDSESKRNQDSGYYTPLPLAVYDFVSKSGEQVDSIQYANNKTSAYIKLKNGKKIRISNHEPNTKSSDIELRYDQKTKEDYENEVLKAVEQSQSSQPLTEVEGGVGVGGDVESNIFNWRDKLWDGVKEGKPFKDEPYLYRAMSKEEYDNLNNGGETTPQFGEKSVFVTEDVDRVSGEIPSYGGKKDGGVIVRIKNKPTSEIESRTVNGLKEKGVDKISKDDIVSVWDAKSGDKIFQSKAVEQSLPTQEVKDNAKPTISKEQPDVKMMAGRKPVGGNSGYVGYSMSRRAAQAYDDGKQIFETEESDKEPKYFRRPNGTIYGIKVGTKIYLNGDKLNLETPAHEAGHIFRDWAKENAPDLYKAATKLMSRPNKYREMVLANETYKEQIRQMKANGATAEQINEFIADEALAHMIGDRAAKIVENRSQFVQWLKDLWESIKLSMPGAKDFENKTLSDFYKMTWEQFGNAATERILSGRALAQADSRETGDIRFMASGISNSNTIFEEDEKTQYYKTSEGEKIPYRVYDTGSKKDGNNASTNLLQRQENTEQGNDFALVERQFTEYKQLDFTAGTKIESLNDVAWLFHNLEDESVEHSFAVYIMPNGSYVVQHLSTGGIASTVIDGRLVSGNAVKMGAKSVAFVHNHPSGALRASNADMHVYSKLKKSLEGTGIDLQDGVIINLKSGKYVTFDAQSNAVNDITKQNQAQHKVQVLSFSKQVFAENYNPDKITGYSDVAMLLSTKKFGVSDKTEMLVLNNALEVVGKFVLPENNQYAKIIELLTQYGGVNAILYGNKINAEEVNDYNRRLVSIGFKISDAIEVKSDNYKSLVSEGLINEDQPLYESNSPSNTDNHEAAKKKTQGNRIEKSPLTGGKRKEIRHIIRDFKNAAKTRIFYTKVGRRAAGTYNSSEGAIRLRYAGDLDTTAHEAGHDIDDRYKVIEAILQNPAARAELVPFVASPAASKPPKGHPNPQNYLQREGFAEWLRAFIVNPDEAKAQAPEIYKIYEAQVHDNMKKAVQHFSNDVRTFAGLEGIDQLLSNVELTPETKSFFDRFKDKNHEGVFHISWVDKIKINMLNSLQAFDKAWNIAKGLKGIDEVLPENDPTILVRLLYGFDGKFGSILETGMINSKNEVLEDANGNAKNLDWLLEPLDRYNEKTIKKEQEYTIAFMLAERTVELSKRFKRDDVLSGIGGGVFKDIEVAQAALDEINALPPVQKARIEEAARRYREFANDILQYMVDKGRLSKEQYDAIKKENVQYVAMQRIIDQEPGTELEVFTMNGNSIGSVAKPVHNIKGSSRTIINPYSSLLDGLYRSIREADRNEILVAFTNMVSHIRSMGDGEVIPFSDIAIKGKPGDKNTQVVYHNGKPEYWIFQQDIHEAIKGLNEEAEGLLMKYGKIPGTILRETITKFLVFAARNFIRDTQDRIIKSNDSNLLDLVGNSAHWKDIARFGGLNSGFYMRDRASYYGLMKESMRRLAKNKNTIVLSGEGMKRVWDRYEKALQTSETINRVAEYRGAFREAKKKGMDDYNAGLYAASRARNLIDFAEAGVIMRQLNKLIPFSNAAVQGMRSAVNRAIEDPGGFAIRTGVYSVLPAVMLWMWNHRKDDDDDKENEYENLPAYQRDMYHNLKIGKNKWLSIPKPYELSLVSSGIDRGMSLFFGKNKNAFQGYGGTVIQLVMPLDESSMFGPFRPIYEGISNYDVFRQKNIVTIYENDLDLSLRHTETASLLGQWLQSASNVDARKIDHFIQGQFGYFGKAAMKLSNINREDGGKSFDITDLGFFKESPGYNSPDVQNLWNYAKRWGLTQNRDLEDIKALNQAIFDAKTDEEKEAAKKELITHSRLLLLQWKAEDKAKQKQDKFTEKQDTKSD